MAKVFNVNRAARRWLMLALLIALILAAAAYGYRSRRAGAQVDVPVVRVEQADLEETVTAQGKLEPKEYVDVGAQVSGQLSHLRVDIGDNVTRGQLIAEIDPRIYASRVAADQAALASLTAQLAEQQAQIVYARQVFTRNQSLIGARAVSQEALEESESVLHVAQASAASLKAQIDQARSTLAGDETNLSYTKIYAPMNGTVASQTAREGQTLNANQTAPVILQIADLSTMTVRAQVAEADVPRVQLGMAVSFTTLGSLTRHWDAVVRQIQPTPELINDVVLYDVLVDVDNRDGSLMNGMTTQMFFHVARAENVPVIPAAALGRRRPDQDNAQGEAYEIQRRVNGRLVPTVIQVGLVTRTQVEIRSGLALGDEVALAVRPTGPTAAKPVAMPRLGGR